MNGASFGIELWLGGREGGVGMVSVHWCYSRMGCSTWLVWVPGDMLGLCGRGCKCWVAIKCTRKVAIICTRRRLC